MIEPIRVGVSRIFQTAVDRLTAQPEGRRHFREVAAVELQCPQDHLFLDLFERMHRSVVHPCFGCNFDVLIFEVDLRQVRLLGDEDGPFDEVLQFPDVAG